MPGIDELIGVSRNSSLAVKRFTWNADTCNAWAEASLLLVAAERSHESAAERRERRAGWSGEIGAAARDAPEDVTSTTSMLHHDSDHPPAGATT